MDSYQAIYDAVRSRISGGNISETVREAVRTSFDISQQVPVVAQQFTIAAYEMQRPSVLFRPRIFIDGTDWCALYGDNLQDGVAGFGATPEAAMTNFDENWRNQIVRFKREDAEQAKRDNGSFGVGVANSEYLAVKIAETFDPTPPAAPAGAQPWDAEKWLRDQYTASEFSSSAWGRMIGIAQAAHAAGKAESGVLPVEMPEGFADACKNFSPAGTWRWLRHHLNEAKGER